MVVDVCIIPSQPLDVSIDGKVIFLKIMIMMVYGPLVKLNQTQLEVNIIINEMLV